MYSLGKTLTCYEKEGEEGGGPWLSPSLAKSKRCFCARVAIAGGLELSGQP